MKVRVGYMKFLRELARRLPRLPNLLSALPQLLCRFPLRLLSRCQAHRRTAAE